MTSCAQARSRHISTRAPSDPEASAHRNVGRREVENDADAGASGRGAGTSLPASTRDAGEDEAEQPAAKTTAKIHSRTTAAF
jgi:hypothetical protein